MQTQPFSIRPHILRAAQPVIEFVKTLSQMSGFEHLDSVLKAVAIALLTQSVQDLCMQSGQTALAGRIELAGKVAVMAAALPLFAVLIDTLTSLLGCSGQLQCFCLRCVRG